MKPYRRCILAEGVNAMLDISGLDTYYGESRVIEGLNMHVEKGKITCLIGRNGVGKSTTLKSIMGLVNVPTGSLHFNGQEMRKMKCYDRVKLGIGYVPQGRDIFPQMTVMENMELGLQPLGGKGKIPEYLWELFPILKDFAKRKGGDLSGGQQQQLAIARALASEPKILILDEPTEGIQPSIIHDIGNAIRQINQTRGLTILIVEQYLDFVLGISDYIYLMEKGNIVLEGRTEELDAAKVQRQMVV